MFGNSYHAFTQKIKEDLTKCFPSRCAYCQEAYSKKSAIYSLCPECCLKLKKIKSGYCTRCGNIFSLNEQEKLSSSCERCEKDYSFQWEELRFFSVYEDILQKLIQNAKFYNNLIYLRTLASIVSPLAKEFSNFDFIVPMPLHRKRLLMRGYNQCLEIVKYISKDIDKPYSIDALQRVKYTKPQSTLSKIERLSNLNAVFKAKSEVVENKTILLFDDVCTTGSTIKEARKALYEAGAHKVFVLYIAGTAPEHHTGK